MSALPEVNKEADRRAVTACACAVEVRSMKQCGMVVTSVHVRNQGLGRQKTGLWLQITISSVTTAFEST